MQTARSRLFLPPILTSRKSKAKTHLAPLREKPIRTDSAVHAGLYLPLAGASVHDRVDDDMIFELDLDLATADASGSMYEMGFGALAYPFHNAYNTPSTHPDTPSESLPLTRQPFMYTLPVIDKRAHVTGTSSTHLIRDSKDIETASTGHPVVQHDIFPEDDNDYLHMDALSMKSHVLPPGLGSRSKPTTPERDRDCESGRECERGRRGRSQKRQTSLSISPRWTSRSRYRSRSRSRSRSWNRLGGPLSPLADITVSR